MLEHPLYNFDHGINTAKKIKIGDFQIEITDEHIENLSKIPSNVKKQFSRDENLNPIIQETPKVSGGLFETAILKIEDTKLDCSVVLPNVDSFNNVNDLAILLSFLSGRKVYLKDEINDDCSLKNMDAVVNSNFYSFPIIEVNNGFKELKSLSLGDAFYNLVHVNIINDLPAISFYANSVLNVIYDNWCKKENLTKYTKEKKLSEKIVKFIASKTDVIFLSRVKKYCQIFLGKKGYSSDVSNDVTARVNINTQPSTLFKIEKFLISHDMYPEQANQEVQNRLKWLNKVRNSMAHTGSIPSDKKISYKQRCEITVGVTFLILAICQYYFAKHIFKIDNYQVNKECEEIKEYFLTGCFRGKDVFNETYDEYMQRQDEEWLNSGTLV
jgi:hypothetical protein